MEEKEFDNLADLAEVTLFDAGIRVALMNPKKYMGVGVFAERNDTNTLIPFLEELEQSLQHKYQSVTADAGYENEEPDTSTHCGKSCSVSPQSCRLPQHPQGCKHKRVRESQKQE